VGDLLLEGVAGREDKAKAGPLPAYRKDSVMKSKHILMTLLLLVGCAPVCTAMLKSDYDRKYDLVKLHTWDFKTQNRKPKDTLASNDLWDRRIREEVESDLSSSGYHRVRDGEPDFLVAYYMGTREKEDIRYLGYGYPGFWRGRRWGWGWGGGAVDVWNIPYTQSTLIVDIVDARNNLLVWRGYDTDTIDLNKADKTIDKGVENLVKRFVKEAQKEKK